MVLLHPELYRPPGAYLSDSFVGKPASLRQRFYAASIDWLLLILVAGLPFGLGEELAGPELGNILSAVAVLVLGAVQFGCLRQGQTIGKRRLKIRIVGEENQPVSAWRLAFLRWGLFWVVPLFGIVSCVSALLSEGRALHDAVAKTKVIVA